MKINVKEQVVLEKEIDVEDLLCVLKHESETGSPGREGNTVRVDKNLLKDAALVIEKLLDNHNHNHNHNYEYDGNAELVEENEKLKNRITKLEEQIEGCNKTFNEFIETNRQLSKDLKISKDTITKLKEQLEGCTKSFNDSMDVNRNLTDEIKRLRKVNEGWLNINEAIVKTNEELLGEVKKLESEKEMLKKMLSRKSPYEPPKVSLDKAKEAKDKVEVIKLEIPNIPDLEAMDALAGIILHGLAL